MSWARFGGPGRFSQPNPPPPHNRCHPPPRLLESQRREPSLNYKSRDRITYFLSRELANLTSGWAPSCEELGMMVKTTIIPPPPTTPMSLAQRPGPAKQAKGPTSAEQIQETSGGGVPTTPLVHLAHFTVRKSGPLQTGRGVQRCVPDPFDASLGGATFRGAKSTQTGGGQRHGEETGGACARDGTGVDLGGGGGTSRGHPWWGKNQDSAMSL